MPPQLQQLQAREAEKARLQQEAELLRSRVPVDPMAMNKGVGKDVAFNPMNKGMGKMALAQKGKDKEWGPSQMQLQQL